MRLFETHFYRMTDGRTVDFVEPATAAAAVVAHHYLHREPPISHSFGMFDGDDLVGVCTFGTPPSRHAQMSVCPSSPDLALELNRLWCDDNQPRNSESEFVGACLRHLPPRLVFSYADTAVGHVGYIYRALSWNYAGQTDADRRTPRFDYVPANGKHSRDAFRSGDFVRVRREPKYRYWTATGTPAERRRLRRICGWPSLPYPHVGAVA